MLPFEIKRKTQTAYDVHDTAALALFLHWRADFMQWRTGQNKVTPTDNKYACEGTRLLFRGYMGDWLSSSVPPQSDTTRPGIILHRIFATQTFYFNWLMANKDEFIAKKTSIHDKADMLRWLPKYEPLSFTPAIVTIAI